MNMLDESSWLMRFAACLQTLLPTFGQAAALEAGRLIYPSTSSLLPEEAARLYVHGCFHQFRFAESPRRVASAGP